MSLNDWAKAGWLKAHKPTRPQVAAIFGVVDRDLEDSKQSLSPDGRFNIAYNAALQLCAIVLLAEGWRPDKLNAHHRTISALPIIMEKNGRTVQTILMPAGVRGMASSTMLPVVSVRQRPQNWENLQPNYAMPLSNGWANNTRSCHLGGNNSGYSL
jgi:hypothetical protein